MIPVSSPNIGYSIEFGGDAEPMVLPLEYLDSETFPESPRSSTRGTPEGFNLKRVVEKISINGGRVVLECSESFGANLEMTPFEKGGVDPRSLKPGDQVLIKTDSSWKIQEVRRVKRLA